MRSGTLGPPRSLLVIAPAWVGDMVMAQSLFIALKRQQPQASLTVAAPAATLPLTRFMPEVDATLPLPFGHGEARLAARWRLGRSLRDRGFDWGLVLPRSFKAALPLRAAGIARRSGYTGEMRQLLLNDRRRLDKAALPRTVDRFVALAGTREVIPPHLVVPAGLAEAALAAFRLADDRPVLALCPGAEYGAAKRWPPRHFAAVARLWLERGGTVWILGGPGDQPAGTAILAAAPGCRDLTGGTTLEQAVALLSRAAAVVSNDSGLMHVAAALHRPLVALYGPSDPGHTPPLSPLAAVLALDLPCRPCHARACPLGHHRCLEELSPDRVLELLALPS